MSSSRPSSTSTPRCRWSTTRRRREIAHPHIWAPPQCLPSPPQSFPMPPQSSSMLPMSSLVLPEDGDEVPLRSARRRPERDAGSDPTTNGVLPPPCMLPVFLLFTVVVLPMMFLLCLYHVCLCCLYHLALGHPPTPWVRNVLGTQIFFYVHCQYSTPTPACFAPIY